MDIRNTDTAVVFIDPQNDVLSEKGGVDPVRWTVCHLGRLGFLEHQRLVSDWG
jgi:hypothetical protein